MGKFIDSIIRYIYNVNMFIESDDKFERDCAGTYSAEGERKYQSSQAKGLNLDELSGERGYAYRRRNLYDAEVKLTVIEVRIGKLSGSRTEMNKSIDVLCLSVSFFARIFREQELQKKEEAKEWQ